MTDSSREKVLEALQPLNDLDITASDFLDVFSRFDSGVIITDAAGSIVYYNKAQAAIDTLSPGEVVGRRVTEVYGLTEGNCMIMRCLNIGQPIINQLSYYRLDGETFRNVIYSVYPLRSSGEIRGTISFIRNSDVLEKAAINSASLATVKTRESIENNTKYTFANLIGADPAFLSCIRCARAAAASRSPIMICGETGTGKEMLAQAVHNYSARRSKPFVAVNCAAIPENIQESELFGTTRGAFTGAMDKRGLFEETDGGSLYLDEIDSMPMSLQAKLLRVLQEMRVRRVGSNREKTVDIRILSSIKKQYGEALREGLLRKDLYYRLSVVFIELPPLRERKQDIETLANHFILKHSFALGARVESLAPEVLRLFMVYDWPGNVRELEHVIEGALNAVGDETVIRPEHLQSNFREVWPKSRSSAEVHVRTGSMVQTGGSQALPDGSGGSEPDTPASDSGLGSLADAHSRRDKGMILQAIAEADGNISRAARRLGVSRQLLHYKLKKYAIDPKSYKKNS